MIIENNFQFRCVMSKILLDIKNKYETLSKAEKKVADFILSNPSTTIPLFITDLSNLCETSTAAVVRFSKKLGFDGYHQLKIAIAKETDSRPVNEKITANDSSFSMFEKICDDIYCSLEKTKNSVDISALQKCCEYILSAKKIIFFGLGNSASVANDASHKLLRLGLNVASYTDNHMQAIASAHADSSCVVFGISASGCSKDIIHAMRTAKNNGAVTIALTNHLDSPIDKVSDVILKTTSSETNYRVLGLCSRITQLALIDTIYSYIVCNLSSAEDKIDKTELILREKKI